MTKLRPTSVMLAFMFLYACSSDGPPGEHIATGGVMGGSGGEPMTGGGELPTGGVFDAGAERMDGSMPQTIAVKSFALSNYSACAIDMQDRVVCWGEPSGAEPPAGIEFVRLHMSGGLTCGETVGKKLHCWGKDVGEEPLHPPDVRFSHVSIGWFGGCLIADDGSGDLHCWGDVNDNLYETSVKFQKIFVNPGVRYAACGVRLDGGQQCWGMSPPAASYKYFAMGKVSGCAIDIEDALVCFGADAFGMATPPETENFSTVSAFEQFSCGLRLDGRVICWGSNTVGKLDVPDGLYTDVQVNGGIGCAIRKDDNRMVCWGLPSNPILDIPLDVSAN